MKPFYRFFAVTLATLLLMSGTLLSQDALKKREFRAAWIATVTNLDWPRQSDTPDQQKAHLINILNSLQVAGYNAVVFQVRTECDALYDSPYEPWSYWLTGQQGRAPNPYYDPLKFAVEEAHKRGMEIHAWFNPYRAEQLIGRYTRHPSHPSVLHPEWSFVASTLRMLDPGLPDVRQHILRVISDVVTRYDVDGVHMDDYFYPYPGYNFTNQDSASFRMYGNPSKQDFVLAKYNTDGTPDGSFSGDGKAIGTITFNPDYANAVVRQTDGKLIVAGYANSPSDFAVVRFNADGSPDGSFGTGGIAIVPVGNGNDFATSVALQPDGKIVVAGYGNNGTDVDLCVVRLNSNGSLDTSFDGDGKVITDISAGVDYGYAVAVQSDTSIVVAGASNVSGNYDFTVVRYKPDGSLDTSFDSDGKLTIPMGTGNDFGRSVAIQTDGKIVVAGYTGPSIDFGVVRVNSNGSLDTGFGTGGKVITEIGPAADYGTAVALQTDGKIVVGGYSFTSGRADFALVRYTTNGALDMSFGTGGRVTTQFNAASSYIQSIAIHTDGKIVAGGFGDDAASFALARYNSDGSLDASFGDSGKKLDKLFATQNVGTSVLVLPDGKIILAGYSYTDIGDWRRNNVNTLIKMIHDTIQVLKPHVKFGMSPFGIWKNGVPTGITGMDAYSSIYCDAVAWLKAQTVDYITPQLYWPIGGGQDYSKLLPWWESQRNGRHFYPGQYISNLLTSESMNQMRLNRANSGVQGQVHFRAGGVLDNRQYIADSLRLNMQRFPAIPPVMDWKDNVVPNPPRSLRFDRIPGTGAFAMVWDTPLPAADGDTARFYAVYRFTTSSPAPSEYDNPANLVTLAGGNSAIPKSAGSGGSFYISATALDDNNNESAPSNLVLVNSPGAPTLAYPANGQSGLPMGFSYSWNIADLASSYTIQASLTADFAPTAIVMNVVTIDTTFPSTGLLGERTYYWRVSAVNPAGSGPWSDVRSFATGWPVAPELVSPAHASTNQPLKPLFVWKKKEVAQNYQLQISKSTVFDSVNVVLDTTLAAPDTTFQCPVDLAENTLYRWRLRASNSAGMGDWASPFAFRTGTTSVEDIAGLPREFALEQNYPNPFNPVTTLRFSVPRSMHVSVHVYDLLGREIAELVNRDYEPGYYAAVFDASRLPSGVYIAVLHSGAERSIIKMMLMK